MDVTDPEPCKNGHERTEDNVYIKANGNTQCHACNRVQNNNRRGWEWSCQACGRRAEQGEVLCDPCGHVPANDMGASGGESHLGQD